MPILHRKNCRYKLVNYCQIGFSNKLRMRRILRNIHTVDRVLHFCEKQLTLDIMYTK